MRPPISTTRKRQRPATRDHRLHRNCPRQPSMRLKKSHFQHLHLPTCVLIFQVALCVLSGLPNASARLIWPNPSVIPLPVRPLFFSALWIDDIAQISLDPRWPFEEQPMLFVSSPMFGLARHDRMGTSKLPCRNSLSARKCPVRMVAGAERNAATVGDAGLSSSLGDWAVNVLQSGEMKDKVRASEAAGKAWRAGELSLVSWNATGVGKTKKSLQNMDRRLSLIHSIAHIESYAIDLSWDAVARFDGMPAEYYDDWVEVAEEETLHFQMLSRRLEDLGSHYGAWPTHDGLWEAAMKTADDHLGRMAVVHTVHEARGVDVTPSTIDKFRRAGDEETAAILERIYTDELKHVAKGLKWFRRMCGVEDEGAVAEVWQDKVRCYVGSLRPPFNADGRHAAGLTPEFYMPLAKDRYGNPVQ